MILHALAILGGMTLYLAAVCAFSILASSIERRLTKPRTLLPRAEWMRRRRLGLDISGMRLK